MKKSKKTIEVKLQRVIPASPREVFDGWLNPKVPGTPWNMAEKLLLNSKVDGLFCWLIHGTPHYGRFTKLERARRIQLTWMSPYTLGKESLVTVTFKKKGEYTLMTLVHSDLPNNSGGRAHEEGWGQFLDTFPKHFMKSSRKKR